MPKPRVSGQNLAEVAVFLAVVIGVIATMQLYVQRSLQARYKAGADYVYKELTKAAPALSGLPKQYDPYYSESTQNDTQVYDMLTGYPDRSENQTFIRRAWGLVDVPGQKD